MKPFRSLSEQGNFFSDPGISIMPSGLIFDVKKYAINDGPGIRLTVFFKGCPLCCAWCHNPESISSRIQKMYNGDRCIGCMACIEACPESGCRLTPTGIITDPRRCTCCGTCADVCPTRASEMSGRIATVADLVAIAEKERVFFEQSGGGVTISGGEPLLQPDFLVSLLGELGLRSIHRTVDTTGFARSELLLKVAQRTELFLYDLKMMDSRRHKQWTGVDNGRILENLRLLASTGACINIRMPLIKGVNDDELNIEQTASFVASLPGAKKKVNILPYHNIAQGKYLRLGEKHDSSAMAEPSVEALTDAVAVFAAFGLEAIVGG